MQNAPLARFRGRPAAPRRRWIVFYSFVGPHLSRINAMDLTTPHPPIAFAWYSRNDWLQLWEAAPDREDLDASFDEWELAAIEAELELKTRGAPVVRVYIDASSFLAWCAKKRRPPNRASRTAYVADVARVVPGNDR